MQDLLKGLNAPQQEAVMHKDGPLMIVAGAGSGKTKVLTSRIAYLMSVYGVDSFNILALTFTNKAAAEMKERISKMLGNNEARNLYIGTFHSVFARVLRSEATRLGYPSNFTIYDTDDSRSVIKAVVQEMQLDEKTYKPAAVGSRISHAKNALIRPQEYALDGNLQQEDMYANRPMMAKVYQAYADRCFKNGAMDFDDLLLKMYEILWTFPEVLHKYQHKFKYVMIDEYQDTNAVQYQITKLLAAANENICVVGDDAQSIYSFRGATIENILQFQQDYDNVKVVKLEQNYRSTKSIIHVANEVIKNNKGQIPKDLWTSNDDGDKIKLVRTMTDNDEGRFVADSIAEQKLRNHFANSDFAILYRTNAQSRAYEENLRRQGLKYKIYGGLSFYQRKEVKDFIAYLRFIVNTRDEEALKRIINYPVRGIGKTTLEKIGIAASTQNITMYEVLERASEFGIKGGTLESIKAFVQMIQYFQSMLAGQNAYDVAQLVGRHTNMVKELFNDRTMEGVARYENVQELLNSIKEWTETPTNLNEDGEVIDASLGSYLQQITLLTDADNDKDGKDHVSLMTIHAAKGLEFPVVYVGGVEENIFPSGMSVNTREELEEERRLFYVAVTRAKTRLFLTFANARYRFGKLEQNEQSRFLQEIPASMLDITFAGGGLRNPAQRDNGQFGGMGNAFQRMHRGGFAEGVDVPSKPAVGGAPARRSEPARPAYLPVQPPKPLVADHMPSAQFSPSPNELIVEGVRVEHQKFGFGVVKKVEGGKLNPSALIAFDKNGEKKLMLNYAKLMVIS